MRHSGARKMISSLKHWVLFQRTGVQVPAPTGWLTTICNARARGSEASSGLFWDFIPVVQDIHVGKTPICIKQSKIKIFLMLHE